MQVPAYRTFVPVSHVPSHIVEPIAPLSSPQHEALIHNHSPRHTDIAGSEFLLHVVERARVSAMSCACAGFGRRVYESGSSLDGLAAAPRTGSALRPLHLGPGSSQVAGDRPELCNNFRLLCAVHFRELLSAARRYPRP